MAVNLVAQVGRESAREILQSSFAQFQADQAVVGLARQLRRQEEALAGYRDAMTCHLGDFDEYMGLRRRIAAGEADASRTASAGRRLEAIASLERLCRGDVIRLGGGRRAAWAVVVENPAGTDADGPRPTVLTEDRKVRRVGLAELPQGARAVTRVNVPKAFDVRSPLSRRDLASSLRAALPGHDLPETKGANGSTGRSRRGVSGGAGPPDEELAGMRTALRAHPCHGCAEREDHARWAERHHRLARDTDALRRRIEGRTNTIARVFDRVCELLTERGYLVAATAAAAGGAPGRPGDLHVTDAGRALRRLYTESDLLVAECLRAGIWSGLDPAGLAACVSAVVYEARRDDAEPFPRLPGGGPVRGALQETVRIWSELDDLEERHRLQPTRRPDLGLARAVHRWAGGAELAQVLGGQASDGEELSAGDFVRWCRQIVDLLGQLRSAAADSGDELLQRRAAAAVEAVRRGVVVYSGI
jgi:ATP-dependent RNA helicase HelY